MSDMRIEMTLPYEPAGARHKARKQLLEGAGGYTCMQGSGAWVNNDGELMLEDVCVYTIYVEDTEDNRLWVEAVARQYKEDAEQQCVLYVINQNETFFIED